MRAVLLIVIIAIVAVIVAVATGLLNVNQVRDARAPEISATGKGVTAQGGQAPAFDVETGSIKVGSKDANVKLPTLEVSRTDGPEAVQANNGM